MPFEIIRDDITNLKVDAIVNPTNNKLKASGGVCGTIFKKAGIQKLQKECDKIGHVNTSDAVLTKGYGLNCKYIIHTVGPIWHGGENNESDLLYNTYMNCLNLAERKRCKSIAFPLISAGNFGYPNDEALDIATNAIRNFLFNSDMIIYLVVFDKKSFTISKFLFDSVKQYIDDNYIDNYRNDYSLRRNESSLLDDKLLPKGIVSVAKSVDLKESKKFKNISKSNKQPKEDSFYPKMFNYSLDSEQSLLDAISKTEDTFSQSLLKLIDASGMTDSQVYKKANIDRRLFSKIRKNKDYTPSKSTVLSLAIALELDIDETDDLLRKAGFALSHSNKFDIIIEYFITNEIYDIYKINETLFSFDQNILRT